MVVFSLKTTMGFLHTCEVQVHLKAMKEYGVESDSHFFYEFFRAYFAGSMETVASRLTDFEKIMSPEIIAKAGTVEHAATPAEVGTRPDDRAWVYRVTLALLETKDVARLHLLAEVMKEFMVEYDFATFLWNQVLAMTIELHGEMHMNTAIAYGRVASILTSNGKLEEAFAMHERDLAIFIETTGEHNPNVGVTYLKMGIILADQGKVDEGLTYLEKSLKNTLSSLGPNHYSLSSIYNQMGTCMIRQEKLDEAMEFLQKSLRIKIAVSGPNSDDLASTSMNVGIVQRQQGKFKEALETFEKILPIKIAHLGPDHVEIGGMYQNIGMVWHAKEDTDEATQLPAKAKEFYKKAYAIFEARLGHDHPKTKALEAFVGDAPPVVL
jgi:tetratricopeptide (TPR) repeat protein